MVVLKDITLEVEKGKKLAIMGMNGSGKTTLLKIMAGLLKPTKGQIAIGDGKIKGPTIGFSHEDPEECFFARSVRDEIEFFPKNVGLDFKERTDQILKNLQLEDLENKPPYILSSGQQRKVSLASVISGNPSILIFDEPSHSLDEHSEKEIGHLLNRLKKTVIFTTHSSDFAYQFADNIIILKDGNIIKKGNARNILSDMETIEESGISPPGIVEWAYKRNLDRIPSDIEEALQIVKRGDE